MSRTMLAGAVCLIAAPLLELVSSIVVPTMSDETGPVVTALRDHHGAMVAGLTLEMLALALLIAGTLWLALAVAPHAPRLAGAGGILGVAGLLAILFANGMSAAAAPVVSSLDEASATTAVDAITGSAAHSVLEPLSILHVLALILIAVALRRTAAAASVTLVAGSIVETAGFATGTRALVIAGFALFLAGAFGVVRRLAFVAHAPAGASLPAFGS